MGLRRLGYLALLLTAACGGGGGGSSAPTSLPSVSTQSTLTIASASITEGESSVDVSVVRSASIGSATVEYSAQSDTAVVDVDFLPSQGSLQFADGETAKEITISLVADEIYEGNDSLLVVLQNATNAQIQEDSAVVTILDDDPQPQLTLSATTAAEADPTMDVNISISNPSSEAISVEVISIDGTAVNGSDFVAVDSSLVIPAGMTETTLPISLLDDSLDEFPETFEVSFTSSGSVTPATGSATMTIADDDPLPELIAAAVSVAEGTGNQILDILVKLSESSQKPVEITFQSSDITANAGLDYSHIEGVLAFPPGQTETTIPLQILGDTTFEGDETLLLLFSDAVNVQITTSSTSVTIENDDLEPVDVPDLNVADVSVDEGEQVSLVVTLSEPAIDDITLSYQLLEATASSAEDFIAQSEQITLVAGATTASINVTTLQDTLDELNEHLCLTLQAISGSVTLLDATAEIEILDDDPSPQISIANLTAVEGDDTDTAINLVVTLDRISSLDITVEYFTHDDTAISGLDYQQANGNLQISAGSLSQTIELSILADDEVEAEETFSV